MKVVVKKSLKGGAYWEIEFDPEEDDPAEAKVLWDELEDHFNKRPAKKDKKGVADVDDKKRFSAEVIED